jgi:hypothetical protein
MYLWSHQELEAEERATRSGFPANGLEPQGGGISSKMAVEGGLGCGVGKNPPIGYAMPSKKFVSLVAIIKGLIR